MQGQPLVSARIYDVYHLGGGQTQGAAPTREMPYCHTWKKQYTPPPLNLLS